MNELPRILVLDDLTGWFEEPRRDFCEDLALLEAGSAAAVGRDYVAEAVFHPAQVRNGNTIENSIVAALDAVNAGWECPGRRWALVLLDMQFDQGAVRDGPLDLHLNCPMDADPAFGLKIMRALAERWPDPERTQRTALPVVAISRLDRRNLERELNNLGNLGYLKRPAGRMIELRKQLADHLYQFGLVEDIPLPVVDDAGRVSNLERDGPRIIGKTLALLRALRVARRAARFDGPCLLLGPRGSGKELFARYIHDLSDRRSNPYVPVNCAGIPRDLVEMQLFGWAPKAGVSDADPHGRAGTIEQADGGTLFLDEIGDMSQDAQAKVLRVVEEKKVKRVSATKPIAVDVRFIAATNKDVHQPNILRLDLYDRLKGFQITLPSLDDRAEDIPALFLSFLEEQTLNQKKYGAVWPKEVDEGFYRRLQKRCWPGNVRELKMFADRIANERLYGAYIPASDALESAPRGSASRFGLRELPEALGTVRVEEADPRAMEGVWPRLHKAYAELFLRIFDQALGQMRTSESLRKSQLLGDLSPGAMATLLLGRRVSDTSKVCGYVSDVLRLLKVVPNEERPVRDPGSRAGRLLTYMKSRGHAQHVRLRRES